MSDRYGPQIERIVSAWHASALPDKLLADVAAALARYDEMNAELTAYRRSADASLADLTARVVAGNMTLTEGLTEWTTTTAGQRSGDGVRLDDAFHSACRKLARKACERACRSIDWSAAMTDPNSDDQLRNAIRAARLAN